MTFALHCSDCGKLISNDEWKFNSKKCWGCKAEETGSCPETCPYNEDDVRPECCALAGCTHAGIVIDGEVFSGEKNIGGKKMEKLCNECDHRWDGDKDDKTCPNCHDEDGAYNIYYKTLDWNTDYDGYHDNYEGAVKEARELIREGSTRVPIYEIYDDGDDTSEGDGVDHFGAEYNDNSIDIDSIAEGEAEPPWHLPLQCRFCGHIGLPYPSSGDSKCPSCMHWQYKDRRTVLQKLEQYREHFEPEDKRYKSINDCILDITATDNVLVEFLCPEELKWVKEALGEELISQQ